MQSVGYAVLRKFHTDFSKEPTRKFSEILFIGGMDCKGGWIRGEEGEMALCMGNRI